MIKISKNNPSCNKLILVGTTLLIVLNISQAQKTKELTERIDKHEENKEILEYKINDYREQIKKENQQVRKLNIKIEEITKEKDSEITQLKDELKKEKEANKKTQPSRGLSQNSNKGSLIGTFQATAYTDDVNSQGKWVGQTASGMKPQVGVIAVDPNVIPLGTKLYVEGYGNCIAGDTGGAIKGNIIDLFMNDRQTCKNWGRRNVKVYRR